MFDRWILHERDQGFESLSLQRRVRSCFRGSRTPAFRAAGLATRSAEPFYWSRYAADYQIGGNSAMRPADALFYRDEQAYYLEFALSLGCEISEPPFYFV